MNQYRRRLYRPTIKVDKKVIKKNNKIKFLRRVLNFLLILLLSLIILAFYLINKEPSLTIKEFVFEQTPVYKQNFDINSFNLILRESLKKDSKILNQENILFLSEKKLADLIYKNLPSVSNVEISKNILDKTISINIQEKNPTLYLCNNDNLCGIIADDGSVIQNIDPSELAELPLIKENRVINPREAIFSQKEMLWIKSLYKIYKDNLSLKIKYLEIKNRYSNQIFNVNLYLEPDYYLKIDSETDIIYQAESLKIAFAQIIKPEIINSLEYIDIRIKNRVYYKLKEIQNEQPSTEPVQ